MSQTVTLNSSATPALRVLNLAGVEYSLHRFEHDPSVRGFGSEAVDKLGFSSDRVFKTLMITVDDSMVTAIVPVSGQLDLRALASAAGGKKATLAGIAEAERRTGYPTGGISPFGQRQSSPVVVDRSAKDHRTILVSAGRRGMEIEISPDDLVMLTNAEVGKIANLD